MSKQLLVLNTDVACCEPLAAAALDVSPAETLAAMYKALGEPIRLRLLSMTTSAQGARHAYVN